MSRRATLGVSGTAGPFAWALDGVLSTNVRQWGVTDLNFSGDPQFVLADEGRPVYAPVDGIVPGTGAVSPAAAQRLAAYGRVTQRRSDLRSGSRQITVGITPANPVSDRWLYSAAYVWSAIREQAYGFTGGTADDPRERTWARGVLDVRHQFLGQLGYGRRAFGITLFARVASGRPFTPIVGSDVNGDGRANDIAFVHDPRRTADSALAAGTRALLDGAPRAARACLGRYLGRAAARHGCEGPWTAAMNARLDVQGRLPGSGRRATFGLNLANPLGGLDRLFHGSQVRGWGEPASPDPVLAYVRGFDPASRRFQYIANPGFGSTSRLVTLGAPFRITLDVRVDLGRSLAAQELDRLLQPGRNGRPGPRVSARDVRARLARIVPDPFAQVLAHADSLLLTRVQQDSVAATRRRYRAAADSIWTELGDFISGQGDNYDHRAVMARRAAAYSAVWELSRVEVQAVLPGLLTRAQLRAVPDQALVFLRAAPRVTRAPEGRL